MPYTTKSRSRIECAQCHLLRHPNSYKTRSLRMTKVCKFCRDAHQKKVKLQGDTTTLSAIAMNRVVSCEACGSPVSLREMDKHLKGHNHDISKIPGVARPGELAEN